ASCGAESSRARTGDRRCYRDRGDRQQSGVITPSRCETEATVGHEFQYPFVSRPWAMLVGVVGAIILAPAFLILLRRTKLARRGWKRVDYVWLGIASLAIFGTAGTMRREIAGEFAEIAEERASASYALARHQVALLSSSIVCGAFSTPDAAISGARIS